MPGPRRQVRRRLTSGYALIRQSQDRSFLNSEELAAQWRRIEFLCVDLRQGSRKVRRAPAWGASRRASHWATLEEAIGVALEHGGRPVWHDASTDRWRELPE